MKQYFNSACCRIRSIEHKGRREIESVNGRITKSTSLSSSHTRVTHSDFVQARVSYGVPGPSIIILVSPLMVLLQGSAVT